MNEDEPVMLRGVRITRSFGDGNGKTTPLREVNLRLLRSEIAVLMGPSGSGKSTLLAILSGLLEPDSGEVLVDDDGIQRDLWKLTPRQRDDFRLRQMGFIFQGYNLFPALTARQQLEIVLRWGSNASSRDARKRSDEMLSLLGLGTKGHLLPIYLSGGEKQRVAIGRALIKNPRYCFADEPTSALDWSYGEQVIELLRNAAHERGATILVVSHDTRILPYVDVSYHLDEGRLIEGEHNGSRSHLEAETWRGTP